MTQLKGEDTADLPLLQQARRLWSERRWNESLDCFERACNDNPVNVRAKLEAARAFGQRYRVDHALRWLEQAEQRAGTDPRIGPMVAQGYRWAHRPQRAIEAFERLMSVIPLLAPWLGELAVLYEQTNQLGAARDTIGHCISLAPDQPEPLLIRARLERTAGQNAEAKRLLERLTARTDLDPILRARAWSEMAQVHDALQDYELAWMSLERSKEILRQLPPVPTMWQRNAAINRCLLNVYESLEIETLTRWLREPLPPDPRCGGFIQLLGFPRSGTTLLEQIVNSHPSVVSSPERPVFASETLIAARSTDGGPFSVESLDSLHADQLIRLRAEYLSMMEAVSGQSLSGRLHLDKNPNHTSLSAAIARIFPESRFLFALRDPRDVFVSVYFQFFPLTEYSSAFLTLEQTAQQYEIDMHVGNKMRSLLGERCHAVRYEDLIAQLEIVARRIVAFLGLPWDPKVLEYRSGDVRRVVNSPSQAAVRQPLYTRSMGRWRHYERFIKSQQSVLDTWCESLNYSPSELKMERNAE